MSATERIATGSIFVGLVVLALKTLSWWLTGSVALLSDALESTVNVATAVAALIAIRVAARPADREHPYGHHKAEFFSAVLEGVMIIVAALLIWGIWWLLKKKPAARRPSAVRDARALLERDPQLASPRGQAIRALLCFMEQDRAIRLMSAG